MAALGGFFDRWSEQLRRYPELLGLASDLLAKAFGAQEPEAYLAESLVCIVSATGAAFGAVVVPREGRWTVEAQAGARQALPEDLVAEAMDRDKPLVRAGWLALPMTGGGGGPRACVLRFLEGPRVLPEVEVLQAVAGVLGAGVAHVAARHQQRQRIRRLEAVLEIVGQWNRTREVGPLLVQIAEAATRLLDSDRASIFLWDRQTHTLVGRPALGVAEGELRVPDDRGVVGEVLRSGVPVRADASHQPHLIDRRVDARTGYHTQSLLCVPLRGDRGEMMGVFEVLNKRSGTFTSEDEAALAELACHAAVALENVRDRQQLLAARRQLTDQAAEQVRLIGQSPAIEALRSVIRRVADTDLAVLILGENGTGKEVVAQLIHYLSRRREKPFIAVNCAAIPEALAESELFGHERGAFTDAREARPGKFELASGGTLLLDEIGDLSLSGQAKLLRVLEERVLVRVGGTTPLATDVRVLAATNQDLGELVRQKKFREDLFYRLNVVTLEIPPLRDRPQDILLLAEHFLAEFSQRARRPTPELTEAARQRLLLHPWPGNVRELRNLMERLAYLSCSDRIEAAELDLILAPRNTAAPYPAGSKTLSEATEAFQAEYIRRAIQQAGGNMSEAAARLGLHRSNLYRKMRQLGMKTA